MKLKHILNLFVFLFVNAFAFASQDNPELDPPKRKAKSDIHIVGHVLDAQNQDHLPFVSVAIVGTTMGTSTDFSGHFTIRDIPEGEYIIAATAVGYKKSEQKVTIGKDKVVEVNFELQPQAIDMDMVVISATKNETDKRNSATIVNVLSAKLFDKTASNTLSESLNFQPGVRVEYSCGNCGSAELQINGLTGEYSQILMNNRPIFSSLASVYGLEQLPASMIERVEVIRGGGSALFGSNAIAGVVNIITKEPLQNSISLSSSTNIFKDGSLDQNTSFGGAFVSEDSKTGLYLYGTIRDREVYDRNEDGFSELPELNSETVGFRLTQRTSLYSKFTLEYHHITEFRRGGNKFELPPHEADIAEQLEHHINGGGLQYDYYSANQKHRLSLYSSGQWIRRKSYFGTDQNLDAYGRTKDITVVTGGQYSYDSEKGFVLPFQFSTGVEWTHNDLEDNILGYQRALKQTVDVAGIYAQNEWKSDRINFVLGARLDKHNLINSAVFSPRASVRYTLSPMITLRGSYASGYRAPQIYNEDLHVGAVGGEVTLIEQDSDLRPEKSNSLSASIDLFKDFGKNVQANLLVEAFHTSLKDVFTLVENGRDAQNNLILLRQNADGAKISGLTLEGLIGWVGIGDLQAGYTFQKNRYDSPHTWSENPNILPQKRMFRTPEHYAYFTLSGQITKYLKTSLFGKYTGPMLVQHMAGYIPEDREEITSSFFDMGIKVNFLANLTHSLKLDLSIGMKNLFDQYQKDLDMGHLKDAAYFYGPMTPRMFFIDLKFLIG